MKKNTLFYIISLTFSILLLKVSCEDGNPIIDGTIPITPQVVKQEAEDIAECNRELLINYGMNGLGSPIITNHDSCPAVVQNCCTVDDEARSMEMWIEEGKPMMERYMIYYLFKILLIN